MLVTLAMDDAYEFTKELVQEVRNDPVSFSADELSLAVWIANSPDPEAVLCELPRALQHDRYMIIEIIESAVREIPAFARVDLSHQIRMLRAQRG